MFNLIEAFDREAAAYLIALKDADALIGARARAKVAREWSIGKMAVEYRAKAEAIEMALANA